MKEVWICDPNYHKIQWTFAWFSQRIINALRSYMKHSKECFIWYPNTSKLVKKTRLRLVFSTHLSVFGYLMKHSSSCLIYYFFNTARHDTTRQLYMDNETVCFCFSNLYQLSNLTEKSKTQQSTCTWANVLLHFFQHGKIISYAADITAHN